MKNNFELLEELKCVLEHLFPLCRSLTGEKNRETLRILSNILPLAIHEVPTGTKVYDWIIPNEWNIRDAWIADSKGRRIVDFRASNLHVVSYSEPIALQMNWDQLSSHLHIHKELPDAIPYRTSYYQHGWGFCLTHSQYSELKQLQGPFEVVIDSDLRQGSLSYGECIIHGKSKKEILISSYICHPSMANDNLSGVILAAFLGRQLSRRNDLNFSYRFVFVPETLGAITYCFKNEQAMKNIDIGIVITTVGGPGKYGYKQCWDRSHPINQIVEEVLEQAQEDFITYPFDIHGSDERQYSSQGFRINCITITKDRYYEYPEYHSSLDNLDFVTASQLEKSLQIYMQLIDKLEARHIYRNRNPNGEVMLSRYNLYSLVGGALHPLLNGRSDLDIILWLLFWCDGNTAIEDIARKLNLKNEIVYECAETLTKHGILEKI